MLPHLASFAAVIEAGSYSAAARRLGIDKTLISRRVAALERGLGVRLIQRTTRSMSPTEAGMRLFERVSSPLRDTVTALLNAKTSERIEGVVRITTIALLCDDVWTPVVSRLRDEYPGLTLEIRAGERFVDLVADGVDFALRAGNMPDSNLVAKRVGSWGYVLCATPEWLDRNEHRVSSPVDIKDDWILYGPVARARHWQFINGNQRIDLEVGSVAIADNAMVMGSLLYGHAGVTAMPTFGVRHDLESGRLVRILPEWQLDHPHNLWIVTPSRDYVPPRVTVVIDAVRAQLEAVQPRWDALFEA